MITVGTRVRDKNTKLVGTVVRIVAQAEPWHDLLVIRINPPDPLHGSIISALEGEVEQIGGETSGAEV